jgi:hypothetical protein
MALELFGFIPDHWQGEALDAFPHCPRIQMLLVRTAGYTLHVYVRDDEERIGNAPGCNGTARPSRRGKLRAMRKSFADSTCRLRLDHAGRRFFTGRSPTDV